MIFISCGSRHAIDGVDQGVESLFDRHIPDQSTSYISAGEDADLVSWNDFNVKEWQKQLFQTRANNKSSSNLMTRLNLSENNLSQVPPQLLAGEINVIQ